MDDFNFFNIIFNCILILKKQMRAIQKLAMSAEEFGKGKEIKIFKPTGAMEIRQAGNAFLKMRRRIIII